MRVSAIWNNSISHTISVMVFWQPFYCLHVLLPLSLHLSLIIHINISLKYTLKYLLIVDNDNTQKSRSFLSMLIFTVRFAQWAALICKMDVSCITMQQTVYQPVDVPSSVNKSGIKSVLHLQSLAYASRLIN